MSVKYVMLAENLKKEIMRRISEGSSSRLPTEMELMQQYKVSRQTVRQALSVLFSQGLIEKRQGSGTYIAQSAVTHTAASKNIAILTLFANDHTFPAALWDMQSIFSSAGYQSQIFSTENRVSVEREILQNLLTHPVHGILAEGTRTAFPNPNLDLYSRLVSQGTSVLFLGSGYPQLPDVPCVCADDYTGGYLLAQHLIRERHTRIAGIFRSDDITGHQRYLGCACALRDHALSFDDRRFLWYDTSQRDTLTEPLNTRLLHHFIQTQLPDCSAVICQNDEIACFLIRELLKLNIRIPQQISVVSFDNSYFSELSPVKITTLSHGETRLWAHAASGLLLLMDQKPFPSLPLSWTLVKKDSDCPAAF